MITFLSKIENIRYPVQPMTFHLELNRTEMGQLRYRLNEILEAARRDDYFELIIDEHDFEFKALPNENVEAKGYDPRDPLKLR